MRGKAQYRNTGAAPRVAIGALSVVIGVPLLLWAWTWLDDRPLPGVRVAGIELPRSGGLTGFLERQAQLWVEESLTIETGYHIWRPTRATLGARRPVDDVLEELRRLSRNPNPILTIHAWWKALFGPGHDVRWVPRILDGAALDSYVDRIRQEIDRPPTPGSFDPLGRSIDGLPGEALDVEATKRAIRRAISAGAPHVKVSTLVTPPPQSSRRFTNATAEANVLMMRQETEYRPGQGRATNIELAAKFLDGQVLMPGAGLSFNQVVGKRERSRGFAGATELLNGEVVEGVGGGVCQVAGTLHAAAFFAGLVVDEYRPHSRLNRFAYLRPGLDTMVAWPDHVVDLDKTRDMRIRNPYPFPIVVKTSTMPVSAHKAVVRVDLYGAARPFRVDWSFEEVGRVPAEEKRRVDPSLAPGEERVQQPALDGIVIMRRRTIYMPDRRLEEEVRVAYPPTPRIVLTGAG